MCSLMDIDLKKLNAENKRFKKLQSGTCWWARAGQKMYSQLTAPPARICQAV